MIWIFRSLILFGVMYNGFVWHSKVKAEEHHNFVLKKVFYIDCNATKGSFIKIKNNGNNERVEIPRNYCKNLSEGELIKLLYNKPLRSYHFINDRSNRNLLMLLIILFIISFLPIHQLKNKFEKKYPYL